MEQHKNERINDGWQKLGNAIVLQSVRDYRKVLYFLSIYPDNEGLIKYRESIEEFFLSDWFRTLCNLDGQELMRKVQRELKGERRPA